jgi:hypothetical protein
VRTAASRDERERREREKGGDERLRESEAQTGETVRRLGQDLGE